MAGFIRRYQFFPGTDVISLIEGVIIVDLPPPGSVSGVGVGTVALVGEFADMTYGVSVNPTTGAVSSKANPVEVFSSQDMFNKVGGFDETIGDTGDAGGSGFIALRNKKFSRLILVPINLASPLGVRLFRNLPTNKGATDPTPVVPVTAATVSAGREFKSGANRARVAARNSFTGTGAYKSATDGSVTNAAAAATQLFTSATGAFTTARNGSPVKKGDILQVGVIGAALQQGDTADASHNYGTFRVQADATVATQLTVEMMDGTNFAWTTTGGSIAYRVHPASDADLGGQFAAADAGGTLIPARPLDATIANAITIAPTLVPPVPTATTWDPLSGLKLRTSPTAPGLAFDTNVQAANAVNHASLDALYDAAVDSLLSEDLPEREVNILALARHSATNRIKLKAHVLAASGQGLGRMALTSPGLSTQTVAAAIGDSDPGVGANRAERVVYDWPGALTFIPEAVNFSMKGADGLVHTDGMLDTHLDMWMAAVLSNLPPERNPGQSSAPIPEIMAPISGFQRGVSGLGINDYIQLRQKGVAALKIDKTEGPIFQSGITSSLTSGEKNINRRRMADFLEDSLAARYVQFSKQPLTATLKDAIVTETNAFLVGLQSPNNPPAQRIVGFIIDDKSGNTPDLEAAGIFVVVVKVRTLATADFIVLQAEIGESVNITTT